MRRYIANVKRIKSLRIVRLKKLFIQKKWYLLRLYDGKKNVKLMMHEGVN